MRRQHLGLCLALALGCRLAAGAPLEVREQHTFTGEARSIAITPGRVWVATGGGLAVHDRATGAVLGKLTAADGLPGNSLRVVAPLDRRRLFVGGDFGAAVLTEIRGPLPEISVRAVRGLGDPRRFDPIVALIRSDEERWVLRRQSGVSRLGRSDGGWVIGDPSSRSGLWNSAAMTDMGMVLGGMDGTLARADGTRLVLPFPVLGLAVHRDQVVVATGEALYRLVHDRMEPLAPCGTRRAAATALALGRRALFVGTADGAVYRLRGDVLSEIVAPSGEPITALAADGANLWLGRGRSGLERVDRRTGQSALLRPSGEICDNHVTHMTKHSGRLVAGTFDRGACVLGEDGWVALRDLPSPMVHGVASDGVFLWVATSNGIARYDAGFEPHPIDDRDPKTLRWLAGRPASAATEVRPGQVALTSPHGMLRIWRKRSGRVRVRFTSHDNGVPFAITGVEAAGGEIFVASEKEGVKAMGIGRNEERRFQDPTSLPESWVIAVSATGADDLWVGTCQRGVAHLRGERSQFFDRDAGLPDDRVVAVSATRRGAYVGTLSGLAWVPADGGRVHSFGLADGLPDPRSSALFRDGDNLWLGTEAGLARLAGTGTRGPHSPGKARSSRPVNAASGDAYWKEGAKPTMWSERTPATGGGLER